MPVLDHPNTLTETKLYGCHNRPEFKDVYWARNVSTRLMPPLDTWILVKNKLSRECRGGRFADPRCAECKHLGSGDRYEEEIRRGT